MEFSTKALQPDKAQGPAAVVGVFEARKLSPAADAIDRASGGQLRTLMARGDFEGKAGSVRVLYDLPGKHFERLVLVGLGKPENFGPRQYREAVGGAVRALLETGAEKATLFLADVAVEHHDVRWKAQQAAVSAGDATYRFDEMKSTKAEPVRLAALEFAVARAGELGAAERGLAEGAAIVEGMNLAKDLGNLPGNVCTPSYLAEQAHKLARQWKLALTVLERADLEKLGMNSFLSVTKASHQPPKFIVLHYRGTARKDKPVVLVGKGITFDTGGISLKPAAEMDEMKYDMCGAASVLGTLHAAAQMKLPINVTGVIPACENMPGGNASKPGDIVKTLSGQTVEILNTDAEGRLILCDALTYVERFHPAVVVDIATLTGACIIALGHVASALYANDENLAGALDAAANRAFDRIWRMPLWDDYMEQLKSPFADTANIGGRPAGSITAACFLSRFTKNYPWAHLDIAGTAWRSGAQKGATGRPVPLLTQFLIARSGRGQGRSKGKS
jgi:leucyl aminopeptidase